MTIKKVETTTTVESIEAHMLSDKDSGPDAQHHSLGTSNAQASFGDHSHNGRDSKVLGIGTVTGSRGGNAALTSLLTKLATAGIITDSTTA